MKRAKLTNLGSNLRPSKKSKAGIACDDTSLSNLGKQKKGVELKRSMVASARKRGSLSADSRVLKTLPKAVGDSTLRTSPIVKEKRVTSDRRERLSTDSGGDLNPTTIRNIVKIKHATKSFPIPVVVGLQCYAVTVSQIKNSKQLTSKSPQNVVAPGDAAFNQEREEPDGDAITKKKRGSAFESRSKNGKTSLAVNSQKGDACVKKVPYRSGMELTLQQERDKKKVKEKQAKQHMISLNIMSSPQDVRDSSKQKENGHSEINVEMSVDAVSDNQPLSRWFRGKQSLATLESTGKKLPEISKSLPAERNIVDGQTLNFEKRSSLWETIESMEAFHFFPQKPHFRPLDSIKESTRERHAINKMVDFSGAFEEMRRLQIDHPRTEIEDQLETLPELESHGFDIAFMRNRLMELISLKDKQEGLESRSREVKDNLDNHQAEVQKLDKEVESIDILLNDLIKKRDMVSKEKEKKDSEIVGLEAELDEIEEGMHEFRCKFNKLATASFV